MHLLEGHYQGKETKVAIICSRFNHAIVQQLLDGALDCLQRHQVSDKNITVVWVPGALEIPLIAKKLAEKGKYDGILCLGVVIRGATTHYEWVVAQAASGIARVSLDSGIPVISGVLTTESIEQAVERAGTKHGNKGFDTALALLEMSNLIKSI